MNQKTEIKIFLKIKFEFILTSNMPFFHHTVVVPRTKDFHNFFLSFMANAFQN